MIILVLEVSSSGPIQVVEVGSFPFSSTGTMTGADIVAAIDEQLGCDVWQTGGTGTGDGVDGASAYDIALASGFVGTEAEWLASLKGDKGDTGDAGAAGADGQDGATAYELAVAAGYSGTEAEWLASLKGDKGDTGDAGAAGADGQNGESAYALAVAAGYSGTEPEWLASLVGTTGADGQDGADGTIITVSATAPSNPVEGDLWLDIS